MLCNGTARSGSREDLYASQWLVAWSGVGHVKMTLRFCTEDSGKTKMEVTDILLN
jgi:hypothetical protein